VREEQRVVPLDQQEQAGRQQHRQHHDGREQALAVEDHQSLQDAHPDVGGHRDTGDHRDLQHVLHEREGQPAGRDHAAG
jgi:hypothetical protein